MFKYIFVVFAIVSALLPSDGWAAKRSVGTPGVIVGPDGLQNFACYENDYRYTLQYFTLDIHLGSQECSGVLINGINGILTAASCIPPGWPKGASGTVGVAGGQAATCDPNDDEPLPSLVYSVKVDRISPRGVVLLRGGTLGGVPGNPTVSDYVMGANVDVSVAPPHAPAVLAGFMGFVKKIDPDCEVAFWDFPNGYGVHLCDTVPGGTARGAPLFRDYGPLFPFFSLPVMGIDVGEDPQHPGFNKAVPISVLVADGFLDGEIDETWHLTSDH